MQGTYSYIGHKRLSELVACWSPARQKPILSFTQTDTQTHRHPHKPALTHTCAHARTHTHTEARTGTYGKGRRRFGVSCDFNVGLMAFLMSQEVAVALNHTQRIMDHCTILHLNDISMRTLRNRCWPFFSTTRYRDLHTGAFYYGILLTTHYWPLVLSRLFYQHTHALACSVATKRRLVAVRGAEPPQ